MLIFVMRRFFNICLAYFGFFCVLFVVLLTNDLFFIPGSLTFIFLLTNECLHVGGGGGSFYCILF